MNSEERVQSATASFVYHETLSEVENFCPSLPFFFDFLVDKDVNLCSDHIKPILGGFPMQKVKIVLVTTLLIFLNIFGLIAFLILYFRSKNRGKVIYRKK